MIDPSFCSVPGVDVAFVDELGLHPTVSEEDEVEQCVGGAG
jgi:hypothetical protein